MINEGTIKYVSGHNYIVILSKNQREQSVYQLANKREKSFIKALWICVNNEKVSISLIQRHIVISYAMTKKAIGWMVGNGYVTELSGRGNYKINLSRDEYIEKFGLPDGLDIFTEKERGEIKFVGTGKLNESSPSKRDDNSNEDETNKDNIPEDVWIPVLKLCIESNSTSPSFIHRKYPSIGYIEACKIIDILENKGFVGPVEGIKSRKILITIEQFNLLFGDIG